LNLEIIFPLQHSLFGVHYSSFEKAATKKPADNKCQLAFSKTPPSKFALELRQRYNKAWRNKNNP